MSRCIILCMCLCVAGPTVPAQPDKSDALPAGAIQRFDSASQKDESNPVTAVAFSPDGNLVLSSSGNSATLWGIASGARLRRPNGGGLFTPDSRFLVYDSEMGSVHSWKIATGKATRILSDEDSGYCTVIVAMSPDGRSFATAGSAKLTFRSFPDGDVLRVIDSPDDELGFVGLAFSHDGLYLATSFQLHERGKKQRPLCLWDVDTGKLVRKFGPETDAFESAIRFAPDGSVYCVHKQHVQQWDSATGKLIRQYQIDVKDNSTPTVFTTSADGKLLAYASTGQIKIHDTTTGKQRQTIDRTATALAFAPDGQSLLVGEADGTLMLWRVKLK